jgi:hypothetical protein
MKLSDGEKLILMVLADMYKHLEIKGEFDPDFISATISGGHLWGLRPFPKGTFKVELGPGKHEVSAIFKPTQSTIVFSGC